MKIYLHNSVACMDGKTPIRAKSLVEYKSALKLIRNSLLLDTDWTQVSDCKLDEDTKEEWREWRQYLRNISAVPDEELSTGSYELQDSPLTGRPLFWATYSKEIIVSEEEENNTHSHSE